MAKNLEMLTCWTTGNKMQEGNKGYKKFPQCLLVSDRYDLSMSYPTVEKHKLENVGKQTGKVCHCLEGAAVLASWRLN